MRVRAPAIIGFLLATGVSNALGPTVPNGSFEEGRDSPAEWELSGGTGTWEEEGHTGSRCISVTGAEKSSNYWKCPSLVLAPGKIYRIEFWTKSSSDAGGEFVITGNPSCNFDWSHAGKWTRRVTISKIPPYRPEQQFIRFGHWHATGKVFFDDVRITEMWAVHATTEGLKLGEGESVSNGRYTFVAPLEKGLNMARPLVECTAPFDTDRWRLSGDARLVFRHELTGTDQTPCRLSDATVAVSIVHYARGICVVEGGRDGKSWTPVGQLDTDGTAIFELPAGLGDAAQIWVRFTAKNKAGEKRGPSLQVNGYTLAATLDGQVPDMKGKTTFLPANLLLPGPDETRPDREIEEKIPEMPLIDGSRRR